MIAPRPVAALWAASVSIMSRPCCCERNGSPAAAAAPGATSMAPQTSVISTDRIAGRILEAGARPERQPAACLARM